MLLLCLGDPIDHLSYIYASNQTLLVLAYVVVDLVLVPWVGGVIERARYIPSTFPIPIFFPFHTTHAYLAL